MSKIKKIIIAGLLLATTIVLSRFLSIKTPIVVISFSFIPLMLSGILLGPWWTMMIAGLADLIGALLFPFGAYFVGYTITALLTGFVYGLFLHRKDEKLNNKKFVLKLIISCLIVLIVCNGLINSLWIYITSKKAIMAILPTRLLKQIVMLPIEVVIMFFINLGLDKMGIYKKLFSSYDDIDDTDDIEESNDNTDNQYIENNDNKSTENTTQSSTPNDSIQSSKIGTNPDIKQDNK